MTYYIKFNVLVKSNPRIHYGSPMLAGNDLLSRKANLTDLRQGWGGVNFERSN